MIVVTAGHVDHGKTTLVQALTGVDTDTLAEEKRRGLTIDLGFAYADIGGYRMGFVDVPGHGRFIRNMLAGVAGPDVVLFVIAGDEGVMPQTREHLRIVELAGIEHGIVALTRIDRTDDETLAIVESEWSDLVAGTPLAAAPVMRVCAPRGVGVDSIETELARVAEELPPIDASGGFRMCVDRVFVRKGSGVVVTGAVHAGRVDRGDELEVPHADTSVRVRAIHTDGAESEQAIQGQRCALNVTGLARDAIRRGDWLTAVGGPGITSIVDVRLELPRDADALKRRQPAHIYHGAAHRTGRVTLFRDGPLFAGDSCFARVHLDEPVSAARGDHIILRNQAADQTIAGGWIVDAHPPPRRVARAARIRALTAGQNPDPEVALEALAATGDVIDLGGFARNRNLTVEECSDLFDRAAITRLHGALEGWAMASAVWHDLKNAIVEAVSGNDESESRGDGVTIAEIREKLLPVTSRAAVTEAATSLLRNGVLVAAADRYRLAGQAASWPPGMEAHWRTIEPFMTGGGARPPTVHEIAEKTGLPGADIEKTLTTASRLGLAARVEKNRWFTSDQLDTLLDKARQAAKANDGRLDPGSFRDATGLGRNLAISVLEYFDRAGHTTRIGDARRMRR